MSSTPRNVAFTELWGAEVQDILHGFVGEQLGSGVARAVFPMNADKRRVAKIELRRRDHNNTSQNVMEWEVWRMVKDTSLARWFAPCHLISPCGILLIQARTKPVTRAELPRRVPRFFWDTKIKNWGRIGHHVVCHDYGIINIGMGVYARKLKRADWWGDETSS